MTMGRSAWLRWRALTPGQRRALLDAWCMLPLCWMGLRAFPLPRLAGMLHGKPRQPASPAPSITDVRALADVVKIAARYAPAPTTCLTRSLVLDAILRRRGIDSALRIGVSLGNGVLAAHAWVEHHGQPVNDVVDIAARFAPFEAAIESQVPISAFHKEHA